MTNNVAIYLLVSQGGTPEFIMLHSVYKHKIERNFDAGFCGQYNFICMLMRHFDKTNMPRPRGFVLVVNWNA